MSQRSDTRQKTILELHDPELIISLRARHMIEFTIPAGSKWKFPYHWHLQGQGCHKIICLDGQLQVAFATPYGGSGVFFCGPGGSYTFRSGNHHSWCPDKRDYKLVVLLEVDSGHEALWRNICSAILDAPRVPQLASTPLWIRLLYSQLRWFPSAQHWLLTKILWVQVQMMNSRHDFWADHGRIDAPGLWHFLLPFSLQRHPQWVENIMWWSFNPISRVTQNACYWFGRFFFWG